MVVGSVPPRKHKFDLFPQPVLYILDAVYDSGLCDSLMHGSGPAGTATIYILTDFVFILPIS